MGVGAKRGGRRREGGVERSGRREARSAWSE